MGISDDWSYIRSAQLLAQTGHVHYVGWAAASVGWQLYLGAAFIKIFGFSFTAPRLGTLLIGLCSAWLLQRTLVRFGIAENAAVLGTLTFVLSPLFLPLSATMMTDVPGLFSILACIYGCVRALQSSRDRSSILWLGFAVAVNAICGTSRQNVWVGVIALVPSALWLLRSRRNVLFCGLGLAALGYLFVFATMHWFNRQPYALAEPLSLPPLQLWALKLTARQCARAVLEMGLLLFPLLLPFVAAARRVYPRCFAALATLSTVTIASLFFLEHKAALRLHFSPFNEDWVGPHALFDSTGLVSSPPTILSPAAYTSLSVITIAALLCVALVTLGTRSTRLPTCPPPPASSFSWRQLTILFGPFAFIYSLILVKRGTIVIFDRYLFALMLIAIVYLLLYAQQQVLPRWPVATCTALAALAFYGILSTHNLFALDRARVLLAKEVLSTGLPPSSVDLGWEMNGWYELQISDHINAPQIVRPAGAYRLFPEPKRTGCHEQTPFGFFPHLAPRYGISYERNACDGPTDFVPVSYATWPLRKPTTLYVVRYPAPWQSAIDVAAQTSPSTN